MESIKPLVFVILPFNDDFLAVFDKLKEEFESDYDLTNAGDMDNQRNILSDIVDGIAKADIVIADLTGLNANVFYELGLAHAMCKKVIIITQHIDELPFDIQAYRTVQYSLEFYKFPSLIPELKKLLDGAIDGSIQYGNPVTDFAPNFHKDECLQNTGMNKRVIQNEQEGLEGEADNDTGFLDNIAGIEENSQLMYKEIITMSSEITEMGNSVTNVTNEMNNAGGKTGNLDPAYVRNNCRRLSEPVDNCAVKLKVHVNNITSYWNEIENDYLELLDSPFIQQSQNESEIKNSIATLNDLKTAINTSNNQVDSLINSTQGCLGVERRLTKAIRNLITSLEDYLTMTGMISSSIDRINNKGKVIIDIESE